MLNFHCQLCIFLKVCLVDMVCHKDIDTFRLAKKAEKAGKRSVNDAKPGKNTHLGFHRFLYNLICIQENNPSPPPALSDFEYWEVWRDFVLSTLLCFGNLSFNSICLLRFYPQLSLDSLLRLHEQAPRDRTAAPSPKSAQNRFKPKHRVQEVGVSGEENIWRKCQITLKWHLFTVNLMDLKK